jgi:hypothetical protein
MGNPHADDIVGWSARQAMLLRRRSVGDFRDAGEVDWLNIAEEVELAWRNDVDLIEVPLVLALMRMVSAVAFPAARDVEKWLVDARAARIRARRWFREPLRPRLDVSRLYRDALEAMPERVEGMEALPVSATCPLTLDELLLLGGEAA